MDVNSWENYWKKWAFSVAIVFFKRRVVWAAWFLFDPSADESAKSNASKLDVNKLQRWFKAIKCMLCHGLAINEKTKCWFPFWFISPWAEDSGLSCKWPTAISSSRMVLVSRFSWRHLINIYWAQDSMLVDYPGDSRSGTFVFAKTRMPAGSCLNIFVVANNCSLNW